MLSNDFHCFKNQIIPKDISENMELSLIAIFQFLSQRQLLLLQVFVHPPRDRICSYIHVHLCFPHLFFFKNFYLFIFGCAASSLLRGPFFLPSCGGGYFLVVVHRLLTASIPPVVEHRLQGTQVSGAVVLGLQSTGSVAPWHMGSSQTRDRTHVSCMGRQILYH